MSSDIEVQMYAEGVSITYTEGHLDENLPGQLNLNYGEAFELASDMESVRLASLGYEEVECRADQVQEGDVFESFGLRVRTKPISVNRGETIIHLEGTYNMVVLASDQLVRVNRPIQ